MEDPRSNEILEKIKRWCAYQERSASEVRFKLKGWKVKDALIENIIESLMEDDFVNDERYARVFVSGKFRMKKWGRIKLKAELRAKGIESDLIEKSLDQLDENDYFEVLKGIIEKKKSGMKDPDSRDSRGKIQKYALSRGFEWEYVRQLTVGS